LSKRVATRNHWQQRAWRSGECKISRIGLNRQIRSRSARCAAGFWHCEPLAKVRGFGRSSGDAPATLNAKAHGHLIHRTDRTDQQHRTDRSDPPDQMLGTACRASAMQNAQRRSGKFPGGAEPNVSETRVMALLTDGSVCPVRLPARRNPLTPAQALASD